MLARIYSIRDAIIDAIFPPPNPSSVPPVEAVFTKIAWELKGMTTFKRELVTSTKFRFALLLSTILTAGDFLALERFEKEVGEVEANRRMCEALSSSGYFLWHEETDEVQAVSS